MIVSLPSFRSFSLLSINVLSRVHLQFLGSAIGCPSRTLLWDGGKTESAGLNTAAPRRASPISDVSIFRVVQGAAAQLGEPHEFGFEDVEKSLFWYRIVYTLCWQYDCSFIIQCKRRGKTPLTSLVRSAVLNGTWDSMH